ncbi:MAG: pyrrolo-quinoline quinone [Planctomycetota bacterium]|nr:MAG: pyrrolo-quinoline quinone [Planctomycetota bacterium]
MRTRRTTALLAVGTMLVVGAMTDGRPAVAGDWPQFRGPGTRSTAEDVRLPTSWDAGRNVAWIADLPGRGLSGPIVSGGRVFVTACTGFRQDVLHTLCFDAASGEKLWERRIWATGNTMCHPKTCMAAPTPATDGRRVVAFYSCNDLVCYDIDGNFLWHRGLNRDYPNASNSLGMASSPVIVGETVIVQVEADADAFAAGIDVLTGETRWRIDRPRRASWTSPTLLDVPGRKEPVVLLQGSKGVQAVDPRTGDTLAEYTDGASTIPSAAVDGRRVYVPSHGITALILDPRGRTFEIAWRDNRLAPSTPSPIVYRDRLYVVNRVGVLTCASTTTGEPLWRLRLKAPFTATPVAADGRLYFFNENGLGQVVEVGESGSIVGQGDLGETILGTPAIGAGGLFVRSDRHLWKIVITEPPAAGR